MTKFTLKEEILLTLYRAGVWHKQQKNINKNNHQLLWTDIFAMAEKQAVLGNVIDGVAYIENISVPKNIKMQAIAYSMSIRGANAKLNNTIPQLYNMLKKINITPIVLKGQGLAQNYEDPMLRMSGDVDLYFNSMTDVKAAYNLFKSKATLVKALTNDTIEATFDIKGSIIELHGYINDYLNRKMCKRFKKWLVPLAKIENAREIKIGADALLAFSLRLDVIFVFVHLIRHYFGGGIGLRQIADWMRMLYTYNDQIDNNILNNDIEYLGIKKIWAVFACMAVEYLGFPKEKMPLYNHKYKKEATRVLRYVLDSGNFGYHDERTKSKAKNYYIRRAKAFRGNMYKILRNFTMFPQETLYSLPAYIKSGIKRTKF